MKYGKPSLGGILCCGLVFAYLLVGCGGEDDGGTWNQGPGKGGGRTEYIMIAPGSFSPDSDGGDYTIDVHNSYLEHGSGILDLFAPIQLPDGAEISKLTYYCFDDSDSYTYANLVRSNPSSYGVEFDIILSAWSERDIGDQAVEAPAPKPGTEVVDNSSYSYLVHIFFSGGSGMRAYGVLIEYED